MVGEAPTGVKFINLNVRSHHPIRRSHRHVRADVRQRYESIGILLQRLQRHGGRAQMRLNPVSYPPAAPRPGDRECFPDTREPDLNAESLSPDRPRSTCEGNEAHGRRGSS